MDHQEYQYLNLIKDILENGSFEKTRNGTTKVLIGSSMRFSLKNNTHLSCTMYQRSGDVGLGVPFNIASYSFLTHIIAKHCGLIPDEFIHFIGNAHIYEDHIEQLKEQIKRVPFAFPKISIKNKYENIEDYSVNDIEWIEKYLHHEPIYMNMSA